jgi:seryl-tRNA synthetase
MAEYEPASPGQADLLDALVAAGHLIPSGVPGLYGRGQVFESIRGAFEALIARAADPEQPERPRFPPLLPRRLLERNGYFTTFPHLAGTIFAFDGDEDEAHQQAKRAARHEGYSEFQAMSDLALVPAACYPAYPAVAERGALPAGGIVLDLGGAYVFRHEPSGDPARLQVFHQGEMVRMGEPEVVQRWRDAWRDRGLALLRGLGLDAELVAASDPFFGPSARALAVRQRQQELKFEILVPIAGSEPTAVASFNYHQTHFTEIYGIEMSGGGVAHTACLGFGHERVVVALLNTHGMDPATWPAEVRSELWPA